MLLQHPDDQEFHTGTWADQFATYADACRYYGIDTPAQLKAEDEYYAAIDRDYAMDAMEARGGPDSAAFYPPYVLIDYVF